MQLEKEVMHYMNAECGGIAPDDAFCARGAELCLATGGFVLANCIK